MAVPTHAPLWAERLHIGGGSELGGPAYLVQLALRGACSFRLGEDGVVHVTRTGHVPGDDRYRAGLLECFVGAGQTTEVELKDLGGSPAMYNLRRKVEHDLIRGGYLDPDALKAPRRLRWWALAWLTVFVVLAATVQPVWLWAFMAVFGSAGLFVLGIVVSPSVITPRGQALRVQLEALAAPSGDAVDGPRSLADLEDALPLSIVVSRRPEEWLWAFGLRVDDAGYRLTWFSYPSGLGAGEALSRLTGRLSESLGAPSGPSWTARGSGMAAAIL